MNVQGLRFAFDNSYARDLDGFYVAWEGDSAPDPRVLRLNLGLAAELGLDAEALAGPDGAAILAGSVAPEGATPLAMAYAGHQFGGFSAQLGDGRALLVGEMLDTEGRRRDLHLKGSGRTPFSRGGDGKAVLGPVLREFLIGEAMHALGIPTTRALAAVTTGELIVRNGREPGAVLARVASSHLRVGTFQFFAARGETERVRRLADYAIARHHPDLVGTEGRYLELLRRVRDAQAALVARWVLVGFVHGVMNTDNMTISGETIDYGPCAFIDAYDPRAVFSSIDHQGRYAYGNQPNIAQWNLARLAETLLPLIDADPDAAVRVATEEVNAFPEIYRARWLEGMRRKLGLMKELPGDLDLANGLFAAMEGASVDFTMLFRALSDVVRGNVEPARGLFADAGAFDVWLEEYRARCGLEDIDADARAVAMDRVNPVYVPRNHKVEAALEAANLGEMEPFDRLLDAVTRPFDARPGLGEFAGPAPADFGPYTTFCGT